jgi:hypothetical protein
MVIDVIRKPRWRTWAYVLLSAAVIVFLSWFGLDAYANYRGDARGTPVGCGYAPRSATVPLAGLPETFTNVYGDGRWCRELDREGHAFGTVELNVYVLIGTDRGLAAFRLDYSDLHQARWWGTTCAEVAPDNVPDGLTAAERQQLTSDIAARGGLHPGDCAFGYYGE